MTSPTCGAREGHYGTCNRPPHWDRWHRETRDGKPWAEWSSVLPEDDAGRVWPEGERSS